MKNLGRWSLCLGLCALTACTSAATGSGSGGDVGKPGPLRKYDFLWVVDHSTSMAKRQRGLTDGFAGLIQTLKQYNDIDAQMAVVTVQQIADGSAASGVTVKKIGAFNHTAATSLPSNCIEHYRAPCFESGLLDSTTPSDECRNGFNFQYTAGTNFRLPASSLLNIDGDDPAGQHAGPPYGDVTKHYGTTLKDDATLNEWRCSQPSGASQVTNDNGSVNSYCWRHCATDKECQDLFGEPSAICYTPGGSAGDPKTSGCMIPPNTLVRRHDKGTTSGASPRRAWDQATATN